MGPLSYLSSGLLETIGPKHSRLLIRTLTLCTQVDYKHRADIKTGCFDGFYTYFAANGFSHGSSWKNWRSLAKFAKRNGLLFSPSVGPGYTDVRVRPWNDR